MKSQLQRPGTPRLSGVQAQKAVARPLGVCKTPVQQQRRVQAAAQGSDEHSDAWERLCLVKRKLEHAVRIEDFSLAAQLRDESKALAEQLPPIQQYLFHQLEKLRTGNASDKLSAVSALGEVGDEAIIPDLAAQLHSPQLQGPATDALWAVFQRSRNPAVNELIAQGSECMGSSGKYERALGLFEEAIRLEPTFAEAYNKRATTLYLMQRYHESIEDCVTTLQLNPHHFGAASGMGLCHVALREHQQALSAFELALAIHPGLTQMREYAEALRQTVQDSPSTGGSTGGMERSE